MKFSTTLGLYKLGQLEPESLPKSACDALIEGLDSPSLRALAGEPITKVTDLDELKRLLERSLDELGLHLPDNDEAINIVAEHKCEQLIKRKEDILNWLTDFQYFIYYHESDAYTGRFDHLAALGRELDVLVSETEGWPLSIEDKEKFCRLEGQVVAEATRIVEEMNGNKEESGAKKNS